MVRQQRQSLRLLLELVLVNNAFQSGRLKAAGIAEPVSDLDEFTRRCPFTSKAELAADQREHPPYGSNLSYPLDHYTRFHQTSGSQGEPLRWLDTSDSWNALLDGWEQVFRSAGVNSSDRVYFAFTFGPFIGFWMAFEAASRMGCLCLPGGGLSSTSRLRAMLDNRVSVLCCTPTYAARLAEVAAAERIDLSRSAVRNIIVAGEPGGSLPAVRDRLEELWPGARVRDHHGMTEVGPVTYACPKVKDRLHIMESAYLAEVIQPQSGQPVAGGQTGELVLTTLQRVAMPVLRYRTGDLVRPVSEGPCACGSNELALQGGILGRADDMVIIRGVNLYPAAVEAVVRQQPEIAEFQVDITRIGEMVEMQLRIEPATASVDGHALAGRLRKDLQNRFALRIPVRVVPPGSLPRYEMKAKRWMRF